jgi:hypothetical protein
MPHRELNDRFKAHIAKARRIRVAATSLLCVCLLVGAGVAVAKIAPQNTALASLTSPLAAVQHAISDTISVVDRR